MPNCYLCGRPLNEMRTRLRRKVMTGEWIRRSYLRGRVDRITHRYSSRIVCAGCAKYLDLRDLKSDRWQRIQLRFWLALLLLAALLL